MAFSYNAPFGSSPEETYLDFLKGFNDLIEQINDFINRVINDIEFNNNEIISKFLNTSVEIKNYLNENCRDFFNNNKELLLYSILGKNFFVYMAELTLKIPLREDKINFNNITNVLFELQNLVQAFNTIKKIAEKENTSNDLIKELEEQVEKATQSVQSVISAKEALESKPTEEIYSKAAKKYINTARFYDVLLICTLVAFYFITNNLYENFQSVAIIKAIEKSSPESQTLAIFFFITKFAIVSIVITLATIFIRRSSHFRKLHDQANQTSLELNALPNYLRQVDSEQHSEIYKDMIPKFFGKELDQSQNDKIGGLMQDQLASGTELIKASAELVKAKGSSTPPP